jgi:hypothetical protein
VTSALVVGTNTYVTLAEASVFLGDSTRAADLWAGLDPDTQNRSLLTATKLLERPDWNGQETDPAQILAFPRTGLTDQDGNAVDPTMVPQEIKDAECELAFELTQNPDLETSMGTGSNIRVAKAGPAEVEYFRPTDGTRNMRFPWIVQELVAPFLGGRNPTLGIVSGTDVGSAFDAADEYGFNQGLP